MSVLYNYNATVLKVVDGDTIDFDVDLGFTVHVTIRTRLLGVNAPELTTDAGKALRDRLRAMLPIGCGVRIQTFKAAGDKYGRWLATVWPPELGERSLNDWLLAEGLAVPMEQ